MTTKKRSSDNRSKKIEGREKTWLRTDDDAAQGIRRLIRSMKMNAEEKITLDDGINNLVKEVESMIDRIDMAATTTDKRKLLSAYKKFLEHNIEVVDKRLKKKD